MGLLEHRPTAPRPQAARSRSYPSHAIRHVAYDGTTAHISTDAASPSAPAHSSRPHGFEIFKDDLDEHPEQHFLSPMEMYDYDWDSDGEDGDDDNIEFDAGILDFALFDSDRRRAEELGESIPSRWDGLVANQASALDRAHQRNRNEKRSEQASSPTNDRTPDLTPDTSPSLRDNLDNDNIKERSRASRSTPSIIVSPPGARTLDLDDEDVLDDDDDEDDDYTPLSYFLRRGSEQRMPHSQPSIPQRPGLKYSRTMSGKLHVWRRPSMEIYPLREEPAAEQNAELA